MTETITRYRVVVASNYLNQRGWCSAYFTNSYDETWHKLYMIDGQEVWFRDSELEVVEEMEFSSDNGVDSE